MRSLELNAAKANSIQQAWLALPLRANPEVKLKVLADMELLPRSHVTITEDGTCEVMHQGQPLTTPRLTLAEALAYARKNKIQTDLLWHTSGKWLDEPTKGTSL